jgi:hypothetical protein
MLHVYAMEVHIHLFLNLQLVISLSFLNKRRDNTVIKPFA